MLAELSGSVRSLCQILLGQFLQPSLAVDGHEDVDHQGNQRLIGADIRSRLFAPDVLLTSGQGQNETPLAIAIRGLTGQSPRHLADKLLTGSDHAAVRSPEAERHAKGL